MARSRAVRAEVFSPFRCCRWRGRMLEVAAQPTSVLHDYQTSVLVDKIVGEDKGRMLGAEKERITPTSVRSSDR